MKLSSLVPADTPGKICLASGVGVLVIVILFTLVSAGAALTGSVTSVESSRLVNAGYAVLSVCGEAAAVVGILMGASVLLRKRSAGPGLAIGLVLNLVGLIVFLPATLALLVIGFFGLVDYLT